MVGPKPEEGASCRNWSSSQRWEQGAAGGSPHDLWVEKGLWPPKEEMTYCQVLEDRVSRAEAWGGRAAGSRGGEPGEELCGGTQVLEDRRGTHCGWSGPAE